MEERVEYVLDFLHRGQVGASQEAVSVCGSSVPSAGGVLGAWPRRASSSVSPHDQGKVSGVVYRSKHSFRYTGGTGTLLAPPRLGACSGLDGIGSWMSNEDSVVIVVLGQLSHFFCSHVSSHS